VSTEAVRSFHRCFFVCFSIVIVLPSFFVVIINALSPNKNRFWVSTFGSNHFRNQSFSPHSATSSPSQHKTINCSLQFVHSVVLCIDSIDGSFYIAFGCGLCVSRLTNSFAFDRADTPSSISLIVHLTLFIEPVGVSISLVFGSNRFNASSSVSGRIMFVCFALLFIYRSFCGHCSVSSSLIG